VLLKLLKVRLFYGELIKYIPKNGLYCSCIEEQ